MAEALLFSVITLTHYFLQDCLPFIACLNSCLHCMLTPTNWMATVILLSIQLKTSRRGCFSTLSSCVCLVTSLSTLNKKNHNLHLCSAYSDKESPQLLIRAKKSCWCDFLSITQKCCHSSKHL